MKRESNGLSHINIYLNKSANQGTFQVVHVFLQALLGVYGFP